MIVTEREALNALRRAIEEAGDAIVYLPVQRQNPHGGQMVPDMVAAMPVPLWERVVDAYDEWDPA